MTSIKSTIFRRHIMKKIAVVIAVAIVAVIFLGTIGISAAPSFFAHLGRTFLFKPVAKFKPSTDVKADNHIWISMKNTTDKERKFIGVITNLGPTAPEDWEIVQYCFSDACYPPGVEGKTNRELKPGEEEPISVQLAPHDKKSKHGQFGTAKIEVYPEDQKDMKSAFYVGSIFIPWTRAYFTLDNKTVKIQKCPVWDPMNKDKTKRYPIVESEGSLKVPPVLLKGSTYLPFRDMGEMLLGAKVEWDSKNRIAMYTIGESNAYFKMSLPIDKKEATLQLKLGNGTMLTDKVTLKAAATIYNGSTVVPLRGVVELFGGHVEWDQTAKKATIILPPPEKEE
jgi:hypothetical protein